MSGYRWHYFSSPTMNFQTLRRAIAKRFQRRLPNIQNSQSSSEPSSSIQRRTPALLRSFNKLTKTLANPVIRLVERLQTGRIFRRLGLPFWTFMGIAIAGWVADNVALLFQATIAWIAHLLFRAPGTPVPGLWDFLMPGVMVAIPLALVIGISLWQKSQCLSGNDGILIAGGLEQPEGKKGLILLVSNPNSAMYAIEYHYITKGTLEAVWLIPSNNQESSQFGSSTVPIAQDIEALCKALVQKQGRNLKVIIRNGVSPADAQDTFDAVNRIFRNESYQPDELIADFTGGTKPMSVGMIMACLPSKRQLEYVSYNPQEKQSSGPFIIDYQHSAFDLVG